MGSAILSVTQAAREYISQHCNGTLVMRVSVNNKGCSGHKYQYDLVDPSSLSKLDECISWDTGGIAVDAKSIIYLFGATLDLAVDVSGSRLIWQNPNATGLCGCGESFSSSSC